MAASLTLMLSACGAAEAPAPPDSFAPVYRGIETIRLDDDLVAFRVAMEGARNAADVETYARCAAAQYALIRGAGFARHVRTVTDRRSGVWYGDAVYTISAAIPLGVRNIDAEVTVKDCAAQGIPTV